MSNNQMSLDGEGRRELLVPPKITTPNPLAVKKQTFGRSEQQALTNALPLAVDRLPRTAATHGITGPELNRLCNAVSFMELPRTAATHGITGPELNRLCNAVSFMELHCNSRVALFLATTARATPRDVITDVWKRITRLQGMHRLRCYSVITFESKGGLHAHIMFLGTCDIAKRLTVGTIWRTP
jgi:hypothetical protein